MKGPVKENDLSWNLPALRMFPELLAACSLAPLAQLLTTWHSVTCLHLFSGIASLPLQPAVWFAGGLPVDKTWLQKQRCTNIWMHCSQSTANISGIFFLFFFFQAMPVSLSPCWKPWQCTTHSLAVHVDISEAGLENAGLIFMVYEYSSF